MMVALSYAASAQSASIPFELANDSEESVSLVIPGKDLTVVKAKSVCELNLTKGQKIFFQYQGRQYALFTVTSRLNGKMIDLNKMLQARKRQIDYAFVSR